MCVYTAYSNIERIRWPENAPKRERYIYIYVLCVCAGPRRDGWKVIGAESVKLRATKTENGDRDRNSGRYDWRRRVNNGDRVS